MTRRAFAHLALAPAATPVSAPFAGSVGAAPPVAEAGRLERVKRVVLSMQWASWEQGARPWPFSKSATFRRTEEVTTV